MNLLVTGGCGFIGSNFIRQRLTEKGSALAKLVNLDALTYAGNPANLADLAGDPRYVFAINMGADYKGFDISVVFQGVGQRKIYRRSDWSVPFGQIWQGHGNWWVGKTWTPGNPNAPLPILTSANQGGYGNYNGYDYQMSDWSLQNGAYIRLKNIVIGYTLPLEMAHNAKIQALRIYVSGNDLWEKTKVQDNWDPEQTSNIASGSQRYPFYRLLTFGVNVTF